MGSLLLVSTLILTIGLAATTRTENVTVGGYYPGIIVSQGPMGGWSGWSVFHVERYILHWSMVGGGQSPGKNDPSLMLSV